METSISVNMPSCCQEILDEARKFSDFSLNIRKGYEWFRSVQADSLPGADNVEKMA